MATTISPEAYARLSKNFAEIKKKNLAGFIQWVSSVYQSGYDEGWNKCVDAFMNAGDKFMVDDTEVEVLTLSDVRDAMLSVKGIGVKRADMVIKNLIKED